MLRAKFQVETTGRDVIRTAGFFDMFESLAPSAAIIPLDGLRPWTALPGLLGGVFLPAATPAFTPGIRRDVTPSSRGFEPSAVPGRSPGRKRPALLLRRRGSCLMLTVWLPPAPRGRRSAARWSNTQPGVGPVSRPAHTWRRSRSRSRSVRTSRLNFAEALAERRRLEVEKTEPVTAGDGSAGAGSACGSSTSPRRALLSSASTRLFGGSPLILPDLPE
mmetsp:Transcript_28509/g.51916  ORF Transcript_28509/g.51916 Transcript_28509/m.51916 type:complete len:219 (+) Transcript_28509:83-739(+)